MLIETDDFSIEDLGIQEEWVFDLEVQDNHNFFANDICLHNSVYVTLEKLIIKKFGEDYENTVSNERLIEFTKNYIFKVAMPLVRDKLDNVYARTLNARMPEKLTEDPEVIADKFISVAPKIKI